MTPDELKSELESIREKYSDDDQMAYWKMESAICQALRIIGYGESASIFESQPQY